MNATGTVVVFAQEADASVDAVVRELTDRGVAVFRADTSWFPRRLVLAAHLDASGHWIGQLSTEHRRVDLKAIGAIWYRDPTAFHFPDTLTDVERAYAHREARLGSAACWPLCPMCLCRSAHHRDLTQVCTCADHRGLRGWVHTVAGNA